MLLIGMTTKKLNDNIRKQENSPLQAINIVESMIWVNVKCYYCGEHGPLQVINKQGILKRLKVIKKMMCLI
jgi:hypothetical protein